jgi:succinate-semialdehyde dehydrogenase/glutarate-semialdehyde dehydrogenase
MSIVSIDPSTGCRIQEYAEMSPDEVDRVIRSTHETFLEWRSTDFPHRAKLMRNAGAELRENVEEYAVLMTREMGKPITGARAEVLKCALVCDYYADNAEAFLAPEPIASDASKSFVAFEPIGTVLAVMPWNFPFWQVFRFAAPGLMAGNTGLLKHASNVPGCALAIERVFRKAGFPENAFRALMIGSGSVARVIDNPHVKAVTLTGSVPAGRAVASRAGQALKKTVMELGGSDPYIILEDADLNSTAELCAVSKLINSGQSCIAAKRFVVVESVRAEFEKLFVRELEKAKMGDPMDNDTVVGPMARHDLRDELHAQVLLSVERGASCILGGQIPDDRGAYYPPTVLTGVTKGMPAYDEELFGPVASVIPVSGEEEAVLVANDTVFGLGAAVFTEDREKGERIALKGLDAGCCFVNQFVRSDPRLPFGGVKESGYGRELSSYGIREFVNIKTVYIR